jgi:hypothetical protein
LLPLPGRRASFSLRPLCQLIYPNSVLLPTLVKAKNVTTVTLRCGSVRLTNLFVNTIYAWKKPGYSKPRQSICTLARTAVVIPVPISLPHAGTATRIVTGVSFPYVPRLTKNSYQSKSLRDAGIVRQGHRSGCLLQADWKRK